MELRKLKSKEKKAHKKVVSNIVKADFLKRVSVADMYLQTQEELAKAPVLIGVSAIYLRKHRKAWDMEDSYLKPHLKGLLTRIINKFKKFTSTRIKDDFIESSFETLNNNIISNIIGGTSQIQENIKSKRDYPIFESFALANICICWIKDKLKWISQYDKQLSFELGELFKTYDKYLKFWVTEIDSIDINFCR